MEIRWTCLQEKDKPSADLRYRLLNSFCEKSIRRTGRKRIFLTIHNRHEGTGEECLLRSSLARDQNSSRKLRFQRMHGCKDPSRSKRAWQESLPPSRMHEMSARSHQGYRHELEFSETDEVRENTGDKQAEWVRVGARENPHAETPTGRVEKIGIEPQNILDQGFEAYMFGLHSCNVLVFQHGMRNCELSNMLSQAARSNLFEQNNSKSREMRFCRPGMQVFCLTSSVQKVGFASVLRGGSIGGVRGTVLIGNLMVLTKKLKKFLRDVAPRDPNEVVTAEIVVGVGNHSKGGRPKIKPRVIEVLELYNIGYRELNPGSLEVCLKRRKLKGGSFY
eukprot:768636-Hanusia_phi.AAC.4